MTAPGIRLEAPYQGLIPWVEATLGGRVTACRRQGDRRSGGRPAFFLDVESGSGGTRRCYARMNRGRGVQSPVFTIEREHAVLEELHAAGIAVPEPYGYCPDPEGVLLERLAGDSDYSKIADAALRDAIDRAFLAEIATLHGLDTERFERRGLTRPRTPDEFALDDIGVWEAGFDRAARRPVPELSFARQWLRRSVPPAPERAVLVQGDTGPGQFLFEGDRLTGIVDWEFAHLGDPMVDLACVRSRDFYNPGADLPRWLRLYQELGGAPVDRGRLRFYTVKALLITPLALAPIVERMGARMDHAEWYAQHYNYKRATMEALAEAMGVTLAPVALPEPEPGAHDALFGILEDNLRDEQLPAIADPFLEHRMRLTLRLASYARNAFRRSPAFDAVELDELGGLLGRRPKTLEEGARALDALIEEQGPAREEELVQYLYRRALREEALMEGAMGAGEGAVLQSVGD